ncbi:MAG TPA: citramalate synthase [Actinobacteria bacterium]|nr:2-isopropylmalate synthase [bacterium BMS3Bbin01]HDH26283.1 citramalate synthase [Actinomycetota bacterium]
MKTEIYDTTLRDGSQQEGISLTVGDKLRIATLLDELGIDYVEGGWPGANPKDDEFFRRARNELDFGTATLVAFGSTRRPRGTVADDPQLQALLAAETEVICIVGKSSDYHVREVLRTDLDEGVRMVTESIEYLRNHDRRVFFDAEHFFDGFRANPEFALRVLQAATAAGAERLVLCDTNGGTLPSPILHTIDRIQEALPESQLGVHFHNDVGCAVASSLAAIDAGVRQVQGCVNGYGERTGNADLSTLIPDLALKMGLSVLPEGRLELLGPVAHHIAEVVNISLDPHHPYVGTSAFTHKAGLHTSALARRPDAYEHEDPSRVGNRTRMVVSELAGRASVLTEATKLGLDVDAETAARILEQVKDLEHNGYHFEAADGSFELLMRRTLGWEQDFFELESFRVFTDRRADEEIVAEATVKVMVKGERVVTTGEGVGPVHALDQALRAALRTFYPDIDRLRLTDYRVRVLDSSYGTEAMVRVLLETSDGDETWGTIGVHENIIEASWDALTEGLIVGLLRRQGSARPGT